ncbi:MAG: TolC family protein [Candidatus Marinimicrobia bacterium]|nr:TolC family protein [Candidatus Neomarinimicrobiota bacterium]
MDLAAIIQEALENNAGVAASRTKVKVAEAGRSAAVKQRLPRLDLFTSYESFPVEDKLLLPRHMDIPTEEQATPKQDMLDFFQNQFNTSIFNGGISLKLPVYTGGKIGAGIKIQEAMIDQAELGLESNLNNLVFSLSKSYYMALQLQKVIEANEKAVQSLAESKRIVGQLLDAGKARNVDLLSVSRQNNSGKIT